MNHTKFYAILFLLFTPSLCYSSVTLELGEGINLLAINSENTDVKEVSSRTQQFEFENGSHQIIARYTADIRESSNESYLEKSKTFVILFSAKNQSLTLSAPKVINSKPELESLNKNKNFLLIDKNGKSVDYKIDTLNIEGFYIGRDYASDLEEFNKTNSPAALVTEKQQLPPPSINASASPGTNSHMAGGMLRYWYLQADEKTRSEFKRWLNAGSE